MCIFILQTIQHVALITFKNNFNMQIRTVLIKTKYVQIILVLQQKNISFFFLFCSYLRKNSYRLCKCKMLTMLSPVLLGS